MASADTGTAEDSRTGTSAIGRMFDGIASRYDLANHVLSFGLDFGWRRVLANHVAIALSKIPNRADGKRPLVIDLATGSGDVAFALKRKLGQTADIRGYDFSEPMLDVARRKKAARDWATDIAFEHADCNALPLSDGAADAVTIAWGLRNLDDRARGLREMRRMLRPGGSLFVLECSQPNIMLRPFYRCYMRFVMPTAASVLTGRGDAYHYLADSANAFPGREALATEMRDTGFAEVQYLAMGCGAIALHEARK